MAAEAGEITQQQIDAFLKTKQPTIYYKGYYENVFFERFLAFWIGLVFASFLPAFMTLDSIGGYKTVNEGTELESEVMTNEGVLYVLLWLMVAPIVLALPLTAVYNYLTKPDIILDKDDYGYGNTEKTAKENWARKQIEARDAAAGKPGFLSFFGGGNKQKPAGDATLPTAYVNPIN